LISFQCPTVYFPGQRSGFPIVVKQNSILCVQQLKTMTKVNCLCLFTDSFCHNRADSGKKPLLFCCCICYNPHNNSIKSISTKFVKSQPKTEDFVGIRRAIAGLLLEDLPKTKRKLLDIKKPTLKESGLKHDGTTQYNFNRG